MKKVPKVNNKKPPGFRAEKTIYRIKTKAADALRNNKTVLYRLTPP